MTPWLLLPTLLLTTPALAEGFAQRDLSAVEVDTSAFPGGGPYLVEAAPERLTLVCLECADAPILDVQLGRQDDGTEARVRSGETTFAELEALCQAKDPACSLDGLDVAPAVGWITSYAVGSQAASTAVVLRDGDLLTLRALANSPEVARAVAKAALAALLPQVVGP